MKLIKFIFMNVVCIIGIVAINLDVSAIGHNYEQILNIFGTSMLFMSIPSINKFVDDIFNVKR